MHGEQARDGRHEAAPPSVGQHEVADLDDLPLGVEMVQGSAADDLAALRLDGCKRQQASSLGERRQLFNRCEEFLAIEAGRFPASRNSGSVQAGRT